MKLFKLPGVQSDEDRTDKLRRALLKHEARIGGELFGPVPVGGRREFFCLDQSTWIWYEEWIDKNSQRQSRTTRYDIRPNGITKIQDGGRYLALGDDETLRLLDAMKVYERRVYNEVYKNIA